MKYLTRKLLLPEFINGIHKWLTKRSPNVLCESGEKEDNMPIYEFRCLECKDIFEILFIAEDDEKIIACPECKGENLQRVLSATNHAVKGSSPQPSIDVSTKACVDGSCGTIEIPGGYD